jgi:hypothetical protein
MHNTIPGLPWFTRFTRFTSLPGLPVPGLLGFTTVYNLNLISEIKAHRTGQGKQGRIFFYFRNLANFKNYFELFL